MKQKLENISFSYGEQQLFDNTSLSIEEGKVYVVFGPSGSGKSTLLYILGGFLKPDSGKVFFNDEEIKFEDIKTLQTLRKNDISYLFQEFNLIENFTVKQNFEVMYECLNQTYTNDIAEQAYKLLKDFNLADKMDERVKLLSVGERQRVAIIRALLKKSSVIFSDEPTASVDAENKKSIIDAFETLKSTGITQVIVTHDPEFLRIADCVVTIKNKKIQIDKEEVLC